MNNKRLTQIIKEPGIATEEEVKLINSYSDEYSYSPFLKVLKARLDNLHGAKDKAKSLTKAAIYIADRSILKEFLSNDRLSEAPAKEVVIPKEDRLKDRDEEAAVKDRIKREEKQEEELKKKQDAEMQHIKEEKQKKKEKEDLKKKQDAEMQRIEQEKQKEKEEEKLKKKQDAEMQRIEQEKQKKKEEEDRKKKQDAEMLRIEQEKKKEEEDLKKKQDAEMQRIEQEEKEAKPSSLSKEIMKNISELKKHKASLLNLLNTDNPETDSDSKPVKSSKKEKRKKKEIQKDKKEDSGDKKNITVESDLKAPPTEDPEKKDYPDYEEEDPVVIKDFLTRLEESNPPPKKKLKKEEQEKLIEKFIQSDPQMQNVRSSKELTEKKDLSAPSVKFRDDIISENLANIMIKQGKHEKAIDIYKKLIWKFPQKKAYFATQIEELKKKLKK